jgi:hypothetical protein
MPLARRARKGDARRSRAASFEAPSSRHRDGPCLGPREPEEGCAAGLTSNFPAAAGLPSYAALNESTERVGSARGSRPTRRRPRGCGRNSRSRLQALSRSFTLHGALSRRSQYRSVLTQEMSVAPCRSLPSSPLYGLRTAATFEMGPPGFRAPRKSPPFPIPGPHRGPHRVARSAYEASKLA